MLQTTKGRERMESNVQTATGSSTVTTSAVTDPIPPFHLLEISLISAQNLAPVSKSMRTYAVTWVHPGRKLTTRTDNQGQTNPTWNDKFAFRVDDEFLISEDSAVNVEIYTVSWFCDVLVGAVRVPVGELITPSSFSNSKNRRFVALQVRRPSGSPQGILNLGVTLLDSSMKSMPLNRHLKTGVEDPPAETPKKIIGEEEEEEDVESDLNVKIQLWRSMAEGVESTNGEFPIKPGSICNDGSLINESTCNNSTVNGSELCSDIGPSASVVAAEIAMKNEPPPQQAAPPNKKKSYKKGKGFQDNDSSILEELTYEEVAAKGFKFTSARDRWREDGSKKYEYKSKSGCGGHSRRNSDGGLFSCFGNAYGIEFTIVCGAGNESKSKRCKKLNASKSSKKRTSNKANSV